MIATPRVRVKICGVTRPADAALAVSLGADFVGLNLWPGSPRYLERAAARDVAAASAGARRVGVFVNQEPSWIDELAGELGLDLVQLHGDEGPAVVAHFGDRALKAVRFTGAPDAALFAGYPAVWGFLVEARRPGAYGGVGRDWDYAAAGKLAGSAVAGRPLLIAGGLGPENVALAVRASGAWGVDVASGVESAPGVKDRSRLERFFEEVRHAAE